MVAAGQPGLAAVSEEFGPSVLNASGLLDRRALRQQVFTDPTARRRLEQILHPLIRADMESSAQAAAGPYLILAIPLLVEGAEPGRVDRILVVDVAEDIQLARIMARDGGSAEQARAIIAAQASRTTRLAAADDVLVNEGSLNQLRNAVDQLHQKYLALSAEWAPASDA